MRPSRAKPNATSPGRRSASHQKNSDPHSARHPWPPSSDRCPSMGNSRNSFGGNRTYAAICEWHRFGSTAFSFPSGCCDTRRARRTCHSVCSLSPHAHCGRVLALRKGTNAASGRHARDLAVSCETQRNLFGPAVRFPPKEFRPSLGRPSMATEIGSLPIHGQLPEFLWWESNLRSNLRVTPLRLKAFSRSGDPSNPSEVCFPSKQSRELPMDGQ